MEDKLTQVLLKALPFKYLNNEELQMIITYSQRVKFASNQLILKQGKRSDGLYIIIKGKALVLAKILGENVINLALLTQGNFMGEVSLIAKNVSPASVMAEGEVECLFLNTTYFEMLSLFLPNIKQKILQALLEEVVKRIKSFHHKIANILMRSEIATQPFLISQIKSTQKPEVIPLDESVVSLVKLRRLPFFKFITEQELPEVMQKIQIMRAVRYCSLIQEGDDTIGFYIVLYGAVQVSIIKVEKLAKLAVLGPLSLFGSISYVDNSKAVLNYSTCEDTILLKISHEALNYLKAKHPLTWDVFFNAISKAFVTIEDAANKLHIRLNNEFYNR